MSKDEEPQITVEDFAAFVVANLGELVQDVNLRSPILMRDFNGRQTPYYWKLRFFGELDRPAYAPGWASSNAG